MATLIFSETVKNAELLGNAEFKALLDKGNPVVYLVGTPKPSEKDGKMYFQLHTAQLKQLGEVNEVNKLFLGWDSTVLVRCWRNVEASQLANPEVAKFCKTGAELTGLTIVTTDSVTPTSALQKPRKTLIKADNGVEEEYIYTLGGQPIYRTMELAFTADNTKKDVLITPDGKAKVGTVSLPFAGFAEQPVNG